ncbi:hypothetical protein BJY52DRAFT_1209914 [Lactarius psammicola]|nr:hypothetical protein BJY52DRAFT_1209914 [Lactarius psammicola]
MTPLTLASFMTILNTRLVGMLMPSGAPSLGPDETYDVDYMGGALYPTSLISVHAEFLQGAVLGNTHSESPSSKLSVAPAATTWAASRASSHVTPFAPLPSHLSRFAAHVDALTNALHNAREHLESCVASLCDGTGTSTTSGSPQDAPALRAYERLRRELSLALRECECGREPLLELLLPPRALSPDEDEDEEVLALGLDAESSDSDKDASSRTALSLPSSPTHAVLVEARTPGNEEEDEEEDGAAHDRKGGVLVVGLERLPAAGIEQVFEADAGADVDAGPDADADMDADGPRPLARPRSKLSRAERIAAAKARRATG